MLPWNVEWSGLPLPAQDSGHSTIFSGDPKPAIN
jgi:hypothetical protein